MSEANQQHISVESLEILPQPTSVPDMEIEPQNGSLLSNQKICKMTLAFFQAAKPSWVQQVDVTLVLYLLQRRAVDHSVWDSQLTLSEVLHCSVDHVKRSLKRLDSHGWIARSKRRGHSDGLTLIVDKLPQGVATHLEISDRAKKLALQYQRAVTKKWRRQKFPKGWFKAQCTSAQRLLNYTDGDWKLTVALISYAFATPQFAALTRNGLYHLCKPWKKIKASYEASINTTEKGEPIQ